MAPESTCCHTCLWHHLHYPQQQETVRPLHLYVCDGTKPGSKGHISWAFQCNQHLPHSFQVLDHSWHNRPALFKKKKKKSQELEGDA